MDPMVIDDGPPTGTIARSFSDPLPPGTSSDILQELSKLEPFDQNTSAWADFSERLRELFELFNVPADKRVKIFIDRISNASYERLRALCKPIAPLDKSIDELWLIMDKYFNRYSNMFKERVKFNRRSQRAHEDILKYATELKRWGRNCKFPESWWQEALITQFMGGVRSDEIRAKLFDLKEDTWNFDQYVDFACNIESIQAAKADAAKTVAERAAIEKAIADRIAAEKAAEKAAADRAAAEKAAADRAAEKAVADGAAEKAVADGAAEKAVAGSSTDAKSSVVQMEVDANSDGVVCYTCFEPGHKSPACELRKQKNAIAAKKKLVDMLLANMSPETVELKKSSPNQKKPKNPKNRPNQNKNPQNPNMNLQNPNMNLQNPNKNLQNPNKNLHNPNKNLHNPNKNLQNPNKNPQYKNQPTKNPANPNQVKNSKNQWNKSKNQGKKQANQFRFQNQNQFKNQYKPSQSFLNYSNQPGGQFGEEFRDVLRNQYKDLHRNEYSNQSYNQRTLSSTYQPNSSLFYR